MTALTTFEIETAPGITLSGAERKASDAPTVILLHGYSDSWRSYQPLVAALSPAIRVVAVSLRGHGDSTKPADGYAIADLAGDLPALMDQCGVARATIVGHSMGSMVAARLALDHPERVESLVLLGALATLKGNPAIEGAFAAEIEALREPLSLAFVREFQESTLARPVVPAFLAGIVSESLKVPTRVWQGALNAMLEEDLGPALTDIHVPTLVLWGSADGLCDRKSQEAIVGALPRARLTAMPGAGHAPHWEEPQRVAAAMETFLASL